MTSSQLGAFVLTNLEALVENRFVECKPEKRAFNANRGMSRFFFFRSPLFFPSETILLSNRLVR